MDERLISFIKKHLEKGVHESRIRQFLLRAGYDVKLVEEHISHAMKTRKHRNYASMEWAVAIAAAILLLGFYFSYLNNAKINAQIKTNVYGNKGGEYKENLKGLNSALIANDASLCSSINDSSLSEECRKKLSAGGNFEKGDISDKTTPDKRLFNSALIDHNSGICFGIEDAAIQSQCLSVLK